MIGIVCPSCRGHLEPERIGKAGGHAGRPVAVCDRCGSVVLDPPGPNELPDLPDRKDLV